MLKTPGAPSKSSKRVSHLFKGKGGGTAPNTPEEDDRAGVTVMANEYDPSQDVKAITQGEVPLSPLRKDVQSAHAEEEKKESEDTVGATPRSGVDVVSKILANFDDICTVPKDPKQTQQTCSIASSKSGKKEVFSHPEWGREPSLDGDETATNPSMSLLSESSEPYSSAYTNSTSKIMGPDRSGVIKKSPSQDHENFEVVLDPTSLLSDDDDDEPAAPKQRRWPFTNSSHPKETASESNKDAPVPPPIIEEDILTEETSDPLIPEVNLRISPEDSTVKEDETDCAAKKGAAQKSLVKRSWKSCKKLIAKASVTGKESKQEHFAEVDNEAQNAESFEQQEILVESNSLNTGVDQPIDEGNEGNIDEIPMDGVRKIPDSTSTVWNSLVASIAGTFDPEVAAAAEVTDQISKDASNPSEAEKPHVDHDPKTTNMLQDGLPVEVTAGPERKGKTILRPSIGWKGLKSFKKISMRLVKTPKKEIDSNPNRGATPSKSQAPVESAAVCPAPSNDVQKMPLRKPKAVWKAVEDEDSGKIYYYHRKTRETTWKKPNEYQQYELDLQKWKEAQASLEKPPSVAGKTHGTADKAAGKESASRENMLDDRPSSPRVASWPSSAPKSHADDKKDATEIRRIVTPPAQTSAPDRDARVSVEAPAAQPKVADSVAVADQKDKNTWERRKEVDRLLSSMPPDDSRKSADQLMKEYAGREDLLVKELRAKVESQPMEEARPFDEPVNMEQRKRSAPPRSPHRFGQRTMTYISKASATTRSSALTDRTEKIKNTGKGKLSPSVRINETLSSATSISSHNEDDKYLSSMAASPTRRVPSRVPVPRERQLMVEELTDSRISAESYEGNGGKRGRIVRGRAREPVRTHLDTVYDGDNDDNTDDDNTASLYDNDTYGTDSVSALSENDTDFVHRKDNFEQARRRALDDAIEREDWDLAAALSEGMRAANMPGGYERAHSSWNQSELDKFIANNDWSAVKSYIARMREKSQTSANKSIGAKSQLQHKELMSESSWTSDSQSSYESYDSESEI